MLLRQIFDPYLAQYAYLIGCQKTDEALVIDPQRDIDRYKQLAKENGLKIIAVTETHIHADFVSGVREFAADPAVKVYLSAEGGPDWSYKWPGDRPNTNFVKNGSRFNIGSIQVEVIATAGHTPEHICFLITDVGAGCNQPMALVTGDFLFVGDVGRPDLLETAAGVANAMEASALSLKDSLKDRLTRFGDYLQILPGHGAGSACGKALGAVPMTTLGYERAFNSALKLAISDGDAFVKDILKGQPDPPLYFARMKLVNRDGIAVTDGVPKVSRLDAKQLSKAASDKSVRILDARNDTIAFDSAHVPRSIYAPLRSSSFTAAAGSYIGPDDSILLVLRSADDSELAVRQLYRIGLDKVLGWLTFEDAKEGGLATASVRRVDFPQFNAASARAEGEIIDVRGTGEFQRGHVPGARLFPYTRLKDRLKEIPKDKRLFVHCGSGKRAAIASSFLSSEGFEVVHVDGEYAGA